MSDHWTKFGRNYYSRHDFEAVETDKATSLMTELTAKLADLPGQVFDGRKIISADSFSYDDPVDGSRSENQGLRIAFDTGARVVFRLSGTGTVGATLRVYLEDLVTDADRLNLDPAQILAPIAQAADEIAGISRHTGRNAPDVVT